MLLREITLNIPAMEPSDKLLGTGIQGAAFKTNRPNTVRKVYGLDDLQDPYYQYINIIQHHQDNPFFPRIYRHRVYKNKAISVSRLSDYFMTGVVMMEKLHPLAGGKVPLEVIQAMFRNLGFEISDVDEISDMFKTKHDVAQRVKETTNKKFAEALQLLLSSGRSLFDLHANNWMVRLTSVGPQLVILDPVYGSDVNTLPDALISPLDLDI